MAGDLGAGGGMSAPAPARIRPARSGDAPAIFALIRALADYERLLHEVEADEAMIAQALFGPNPRAFCDIAERDGEAVGIALWFYNFSTFRGRHGLYLEDLFVDPAHRGLGIGRALMAHLAARCAREGLARFEWWVLDWNAPAIALYEGLGARRMSDWTVCRLDGAALARLAAEDLPGGGA